MGKVLDLSKSVHDLVKEYPELVDIMAKLGFTEITKKAMLNSVGRIMTIPKGAATKNIPMPTVIAALIQNGFELTGAMPTFGKDTQESKSDEKSVQPQENTTEQLKSYLKRLGEGEDLESVRKDFAEKFEHVEASEIMKAEQELLAEGTPLQEVQRLCDVHSALFHGATKEEQIANAEKAVEASLAKEKQAEAAELARKIQVSTTPNANYNNKKERAKELVETVGHPLHTFTAENEALAKLLAEAIPAAKNNENIDEYLTKIREVSIHYAKKGDLFYPLLKVRYEISGPSDVMWTVDDEIRDELSALVKETEHTPEWYARVDAVLKRVDEMIYKEANILFPICAVNFTDAEWKSIYQDAKDYAECFGVTGARWEAAEVEKEAQKQAGSITDGEVVMPGGHMSVAQLTALLNTLPIEITFVDADNINRFFNEGPKVFKRPQMAIDREVFSCHPPKIEPMVRAIIDDFRNNRRDSVPVWMEKGGKTMLVTYMAVRDRKGTYMGTVEVVQDMEFAKEHFLPQTDHK